MKSPIRFALLAGVGALGALAMAPDSASAATVQMQASPNANCNAASPTVNGQVNATADGTGAQCVRPVKPYYQLLGAYGGSGATVSGSVLGPVAGGRYVYRVMGTFASCTATLKVTDADGATPLTLDTETSAASKDVLVGASALGAGANLQVVLSGCAGGQALWASLAMDQQ